jgi:hypothetical protein
MNAKRTMHLVIAISLAAVTGASMGVHSRSSGTAAPRAAQPEPVPVSTDYLPAHFVEEARAARIEPLPPQF